MAWPAGRIALECIDIEDETHDVKTFHFRVRTHTQPGEVPLCLHRPGQFITLRLRHGDVLVPRSYTISSPPSRPLTLCLTIKRDPDGLVSRFMHDRLRIGQVIPANGPSGTFDLVSIAPRPRIVMLSGGSGITPMMSMLRYLHDTRATDHAITFLHSARTPKDIIFRQELGLIARRLDLTLGFICENGAEDGMDQGYLDRGMLDRHVPDIRDCTVLTCGPAPYMNAVKSMLADLKFDMDHYHDESFGTPSERQNPDGATPESLSVDAVELPGDVPADPPAQSAPAATAGPDQITFTVSGKTAAYSAGETILDVATREGIAIPTNCQMGLCGTCKTTCTSGIVEMDDTEGLAPGEQEAGYVLTCCGRPRGPVSIDF